MFVETDFLIALSKNEDWLKEDAEAVLENHDVHTSVATYTEFLVYYYDPEESEYRIEASKAVPNLLEVVPVRPAEHEEGLLAASAFIDEYGLTPFDAVHAGIAHVEDETVISTEEDSTPSVSNASVSMDTEKERVVN